MHLKDRQKMCTSCDGRIPLDADLCPYCAAEQTTAIAPASSAKELHHQSLQDSLTALYSPPQVGKNTGLMSPVSAKNLNYGFVSPKKVDEDAISGKKQDQDGGKIPGFERIEPKTQGQREIPNLSKPQPLKDPMAEKRFNHSSAALGVPTIPVESSEEQHADEGRSSFWPIMLLSIGANLLTIGLLQLFFSDNGFLRLEWDSSNWFVYCLAALPLFFFGFKKANTMKG